MINTFKIVLRKNFAASIDMLKNAIVLCPEDHWKHNKRFYYIAYHTTVFLDYYLTIPPKNFSASLSYTLQEPENIPSDAVDDVVPDKIYTKEELITYVEYVREKCTQIISQLTEEKLNARWIDESGDMDLSLAGSGTLEYSILEIFFYNLRHVQHHAAQLNLLLRQAIDKAPDFISQSDD
jgi:hypothetical protein